MDSSVGLKAGGFSVGGSVSLTYSFGYSTTTAATQFRDETDTVDLVDSPTTAAAVWNEGANFRLRVRTGDLVGDGHLLNPTDTSYKVDHFP